MTGRKRGTGARNSANAKRKPAPAKRKAGNSDKKLTKAQQEMRPSCFSATTSMKTRRVFYIATRMAAGTWPKKGTKDYRALYAELAHEWGLAEASVRDMTSDASRMLTLIGQKAQLVNVARTRLLAIAGEDGPDRVGAIRTLLENLGELSTRKKVELGGEIGVEGGARLVFMPAEDPEPEPPEEPEPSVDGSPSA